MVTYKWLGEYNKKMRKIKKIFNFFNLFKEKNQEILSFLKNYVYTTKTLVYILTIVIVLQSLGLILLLREFEINTKKSYQVLYIYQTKSGNYEFGKAEFSFPVTKKNIPKIKKLIKTSEPYRDIWILNVFELKDD